MVDLGSHNGTRVLGQRVGVFTPIGAGELACTEPCQGPPNDLCPEGFHCNAEPAQQGVCRPDDAEATGCCSVEGRGGNAVLLNVGLGGVVALLVARRRRRR